MFRAENGVKNTAWKCQYKHIVFILIYLYAHSEDDKHDSIHNSSTTIVCTLLEVLLQTVSQNKFTILRISEHTPCVIVTSHYLITGIHQVIKWKQRGADPNSSTIHHSNQGFGEVNEGSHVSVMKTVMTHHLSSLPCHNIFKLVIQ